MYKRKIPKNALALYKVTLNRIIRDLTELKEHDTNFESKTDRELSNLIEELGVIRDIDFALGVDEIKKDTSYFLTSIKKYLKKKGITEGRLNKDVDELEYYSQYL